MTTAKRQGNATKLIEEIKHLYQNMPILLNVSNGYKNTNALVCYLKNGFVVQFSTDPRDLVESGPNMIPMVYDPTNQTVGVYEHHVHNKESGLTSQNVSLFVKLFFRAIQEVMLKSVWDRFLIHAKEDNFNGAK